jgi:hypothetical protein
MDVSKDYTLLFEEVLKKEGVNTRLDLFPGLIHGFWSFCPKAGFTINWLEKTDVGFEWLLKEGTAEKQYLQDWMCRVHLLHPFSYQAMGCGGVSSDQWNDSSPELQSASECRVSIR